MRDAVRSMLPADSVVFLLDVDNTLLDNDRFAVDLGARLEHGFGAAERDRYWATFTRLREQRGYADYLAAAQEWRTGLEDNQDLLQISAFLLEYPFAERLYPRALEAIAHLHTLGTPVVLSDGDVIFQPRKIQHAGIWEAVEGRVLIYVHKEKMLQAMERHYPATHYVMVDDKPNLLAAMKRVLGSKLSTVFVRQGHYARDADLAAIKPSPDLCIDRIGDLLDCDLLASRARQQV
jgi:FMN phosphatase YigB (HAD superfamily)